MERERWRERGGGGGERDRVSEGMRGYDNVVTADYLQCHQSMTPVSSHHFHAPLATAL